MIIFIECDETCMMNRINRVSLKGPQLPTKFLALSEKAKAKHNPEIYGALMWAVNALKYIVKH